MLDLAAFETYCHAKKSFSEAKQDLFVQYVLHDKHGGFFVDFGAAGGVVGSNSYLLETTFGWDGIVCEPCRAHHKSLRENRTCHIDFECVYTSTGKTVVFVEPSDPNLATIDSYVGSDKWKETRLKHCTKYPVQTVSLHDLLERYNAPNEIDYLSLDTEGSEFHILCNYDFSRTIKVLTIEHNNNAYRQGIFDLMTERGYERIEQSICSWDDWYVKRER